MNESELQKINNYPIYPRDSKIPSDKGFVNIDNGSQGGTHWTCFIVEDNKSYYFDSFGVAPDNFLLNQLPKPLPYHNYKIQDINSKLCGSYCLYFVNLIERMNYYDTILKNNLKKIISRCQYVFVFAQTLLYIYLNKYFYLNMPIKVSGNCSNNFEHKIDNNLFVLKPYLRTN